MLNRSSFKKYLFIFLIFLIAFNQSCHYAPKIIPTSIESFEGYARINIKNSNILKSKIAFLFFGEYGKINILTPFGTTKAQILIFSDISYLTIPEKKVYWEGSTEEIMKVFLGFDLDLVEIKALLTGKWGKNLKGWEFFRDTVVPKIINFSYAEGYGKIKILKIKFNQPIKSGVFSKFFVKYYQKKTLDEIMEMLENGN